MDLDRSWMAQKCVQKVPDLGSFSSGPDQKGTGRGSYSQ